MTKKIKKAMLICFGLLFVGFAFLGVVLPGLPTVPLLLLAAACFARSSPRLHDWLLENNLFGPLIRDWQEYRIIPMRAKVIGISMLLLVGYFSVIRVDQLWLKTLIVLLLLIPFTILIRARNSL